jgi:hypothetical protein
MPTLIDWIEQQMSSDDDNGAKQSSKLRTLFERSSARERQALDDALICLCGCSLKTALENSSEDDA